MATSFNFTFKTFNNPADPPFNGVTFNNLMGINNFGLIAGFYGSGQAGDPNQGFLLNRPHQYTAVDFPHVAQTQVTGLNDFGTLVGYLYRTNNGTAVDNQFGFYERDGVFVEVNNPHTPKNPPSGTLIENQLMGVNDFNMAVGFYNDASGNSHGYTYNINKGTFSADINDPNAVGTVTAAINNLGGLVGFYKDAAGVTHGFVDNHGHFATVNAPGADGTQLLGVNDFGVAVGLETVGTALHGIIYNEFTHKITVLDDPKGIGTTTFNGINDLGQIVGFYVDSKGNTDGLLAQPDLGRGGFAGDLHGGHAGAIAPSLFSSGESFGMPTRSIF
jgi:hypothetical protein